LVRQGCFWVHLYDPVTPFFPYPQLGCGFTAVASLTEIGMIDRIDQKYGATRSHKDGEGVRQITPPNPLFKGIFGLPA
jgi:hypothetical protein